MPRKALANPPPAIVPDLEEICVNLIDLQKKRRFCIKEQSRNERSIEALIAWLAGYHTGLPQAERKALMRLARKMRLAIEKAGPAWQPPESGPKFKYVSRIVCRVAEARVPWDEMRVDIEDEMRALARQLPVWSAWVRHVKGVSELGLAVIVGETGNLDNYANPAKVWKRLGLAVLNGVRQGGLTKLASADDWVHHGYNRHRRAEIWAFLDDVMFRAQWRGAKTDDDGDVIVPAHPIGPYGEVYMRRKAWNLARDWVPLRAERDARRYMTKRFLRHLWQEWRRAAMELLDTIDEMPPAAHAA